VDDPYPPQLRALVATAFERLEAQLRDATPVLAEHLLAWARRLPGDEPAERYFTDARAFPMLLLPWWLEATISAEHDLAFQSDVARSTISGYYFVRLIDDLMDGDRAVPGPVLPALIVLHAEFQAAYQAWFAAQHPFWGDFHAASDAAAETASRDAALESVDLEAFERIAARKISGALVPLAAVAHRHGRPDVLPPWSAFVDRLGRWHQMVNDTLGWTGDLARARPTYLLSEARRRRPGAPAAWIIGPGLEWAHDRIERWMEELLAVADTLAAPPVRSYLEARRLDLDEQWAAMMQTVGTIRAAEATLTAAAAGLTDAAAPAAGGP
jgi:hypothetical protein